MQIGYARTSTVDQVAGFEAQRRDLSAAGCKKVFAEQVSSVAERQQLMAALDYLRDGDTLIVTKLDRVARSVRDLMEIVHRIETKGAGLRILAMNLDTTTPTGTLMLQVLGAVAEFERSMMLERQREGIAKAKAEGKYQGTRQDGHGEGCRRREPTGGGGQPDRRGSQAQDRQKQRLQGHPATQHQASADDLRTRMIAATRVPQCFFVVAHRGFPEWMSVAVCGNHSVQGPRCHPRSNIHLR